MRGDYCLTGCVNSTRTDGHCSTVNAGAVSSLGKIHKITAGILIIYSSAEWFPAFIKPFRGFAAASRIRIAFHS